MENFSTLSASVSGGNVTLSWTLPGDAAHATTVLVQRADYGTAGFVTLATQAATVLTYTDAPGAGDFSYRVVANTGGSATAVLVSNVVDVTTEATTGVITLSGTVLTPDAIDISGPRNYSRVKLSWTFDDSDTDDDVLKYTVQRSIDAGTTWRDAAVTSQLAHDELLPTGTGSVQFRVLGSLPNVGTGNQLNTPIVTTSNVLTVTV